MVKYTVKFWVLRQHLFGVSTCMFKYSTLRLLLKHTRVVIATPFECYFSITGLYCDTPRGVGTAPFEPS